MGKTLDLTGRVFGRLKAVKQAGKKGTNVVWLCQCTCGNAVHVTTAALCRNSRPTKSCGCLHKEITANRVATHGATRGVEFHPLYKMWSYMKDRCSRKNAGNYSNYGGRGISVCPEWEASYEAFRDYMLSLPNCPANAQTKGRMNREIDRYPNNDGNYEPGNVRWATRKEQMNNVSYNKIINVTVRGVVVPMTLTELVEKYGKVSYSSVRGRLSRGWSIRKAVLTPKMKSRYAA